MMANHIIGKFVSLPPEHRQETLQKLVRAMNAEERDLLRHTLAQMNDPFWVLPTELILQVFSQLSLYNIWTLQRVCKRWRSTLSSEDFIRTAVSRWQTENPQDSGRRGSDHGSIQNKVQHMQAMKLALPLSEAIIDDTGTGLQGPQPKLSLRKLDLNGSRIAYVSSRQGQGDAIVVHDLIDGNEWTVRGEARERIVCLFMTSAVVAFVTFDGFLYVWQFSSPREEASRIQLPSSRIRAAAGDGQTVAIAMDRQNADGLHVGTVVLFHAGTGQVQSFEPDATGRNEVHRTYYIYSGGMLVDNERGTVDLFGLYYYIHDDNTVSRPRKYLRVTHFRTSFYGDHISSHLCEREIDFEISVRGYQFLLAPPCSTGYQNQYRIAVGEVPFMGGLPFRLKFAALYDSEQDKLSSDATDWSSLRPMDILWKNEIYRPCVPDDWFEYVFYMNDTFMVSLEVSKMFTQRSRIRILCYDPDVKLVDSNDTGNLQYLIEKFGRSSKTSL